ncbi:GDSL-type esterase/lipase family protein [Cohnella mopanensis]|uniref:GDSL-type esterase/lipase family protein n=1 Tax=Cohnella mopanensis TaxID=2911966 RepID=UPI001EF851E4|nr:GDSL-type esterase/lipase family protein [Cohnella mopanensis]
MSDKNFDFEQHIAIIKPFLENVQKQRLATFFGLNPIAKKHGIVFIGDSITEGFSIHEMLDCKKAMYNRGVGGYKTENVLANLKHLVYDLEPERVFLLIGTNDLGEGNEPEEIVSRIEEIISSIQTTIPDIHIFVQSVYPVNNSEEANTLPVPMVGPRTNENIMNMNQSLRDSAQKLNFNYIDLYSKLLDEDGRLKVDFTFDGLHLNIKGYEIVSQEIDKFL